MMKQIILTLLLIGVAVSAQVTREQINTVKDAIAAAVQQENQCTTRGDCASIATGSRACGGPSGYAVYSLKSSNAQQIRELAQRSTQLEQQYNQENSVISICSFMMPPTVTCNENHQCVAGVATSPL